MTCTPREASAASVASPAPPAVLGEELGNGPAAVRALDARLHERLIRFGLTTEEIGGLLGRLTDDELRELTERVDELDIGGASVGLEISQRGWSTLLRFGALAVLGIVCAIVKLVDWVREQHRPASPAPAAEVPTD